ncbi:hypothetical protein IT575_04945 [bacterium]|nr:hypothetical protein [bacterium]
MRLLLIIAALAALAGCSASSPYESPKSAFLVPVLTVDSGVINLVDGNFDIGGDPGSGGVIPGDAALPRVFIPNDTILRSAEQVYDLDGDRDLDYMVITLRALSAQAALSNTAFKGSEAVFVEDFIKVGGASIQPHDLRTSEACEITLPVHALNTDNTLELYKLTEVSRDDLDGALSGGRQTSGVPSVVGRWVFVQTLTPNTDGSVTFEVGGDGNLEPDFGQFCVVSDVIPTGGAS